MIEPSRLETALIAAARRFAPILVPTGWAKPGDYAALMRTLRPLPDLADRLAAEGVVCLISTLAAEQAREAAGLYKVWADQYTGIYTLLAEALFPSFTSVQAFYADSSFPPIVIVTGAALPVTQALAGYVAPFTASRRAAYHAASDVELRGLLDVVLDELEAGDLPRDQYRALRDQGAGFVRAILTSPIQPLALTTPQTSMVGEIPAANAPLPADAPPPDLPESIPMGGTPTTPPIFFAADRPPTHRPPVPDMPPRRRPGGR